MKAYLIFLECLYWIGRSRLGVVLLTAIAYPLLLLMYVWMVVWRLLYSLLGIVYDWLAYCKIQGRYAIENCKSISNLTERQLYCNRMYEQVKCDIREL